LLNVLALAAAFVPGAAESPKVCPREPAAELVSLPYDAFDRGDGATAWRTLLNRNCVDAAVATLKAYQHANQARMTPEQCDEISFHMGQALAMSGRDADSIPYFERATRPSSSTEWRAYVFAHLAFARKDRGQLERALAEYEKAASPTSMRVSVIRGFLKCIDKPYMEAAHCSM
jgi:hypothetical protein